MIEEAQPLKAGGITIWTEGDVLLLKYSAWYYGFLETKRVPRANITSVSWKEPGDWLAGFMELEILGEKPPSPHASPNVQNQIAYNMIEVIATSSRNCVTGLKQGERAKLGKAILRRRLQTKSRSSANFGSKAS